MSSSHELPQEWRKKALVVIPAWNEANSIQNVIRSAQSVGGVNILVVDDGSSDDTDRLARDAGAEVIIHPMNLGAWTAIQTGFRYALANDYQAVLTMDADGQHLAESIPVILKAFQDSHQDVIIGASPDRADRFRQLSWSFFRMITKIDLEDFTSGLKIYNARAMELLIRERAYLFDYQDLGALLLMQRFGLKIKEVPVPMQQRHHGKSRIFSSWWQVIRYMLLSTALIISKFRHLENDDKNKRRGK